VAGLTRRAALGLAAGAGLAGVLAGCGLTAPSRVVRGPAQPVLLADPALVPAAQALAQAYGSQAGAQAAPLVQVADPSLRSAVQQMLQGGSTVAPDLIFATPAVRNLRTAGSMMLNLAPALAGTGIASGLYPACLQYGAAGDRQLILPAFRDPLVVFYNSDALARSGSNPPPVGWTLEAFTLLCQQLRAAPHGLVAPLANATNVFNLELFCAFVVGFGGALLDAGTVGYAPLFASAQGADACGALAGLHPYEPAAPSAAPRDLFGRGQVALYFGHHSDMAPLQAQIGGLFAWNVAALPLFPVRAARPVQADGLAAVTADPQRRGAATALALFAGTPAAQQALAGTGTGVPALMALAGSALWRTAGPQIDDGAFVGDPADDIVVPLPLHLVAPYLADALAAIVGGYPQYTALVEAATVAQYQLATWQD